MKFQITSGWPIGSWFVPPGTIIDTDKPDHELTREERLALGRLPPRDAVALNEETYELMVKEYETGRRGNGWKVHRRYDGAGQ
jgi:hypothetical protein